MLPCWVVARSRGMLGHQQRPRDPRVPRVPSEHMAPPPHLRSRPQSPYKDKGGGIGEGAWRRCLGGVAYSICRIRYGDWAEKSREGGGAIAGGVSGAGGEERGEA